MKNSLLLLALVSSPSVTSMVYVPPEPKVVYGYNDIGAAYKAQLADYVRLLGRVNALETNILARNRIHPEHKEALDGMRTSLYNESLILKSLEGVDDYMVGRQLLLNIEKNANCKKDDVLTPASTVIRYVCSDLKLSGTFYPSPVSTSYADYHISTYKNEYLTMQKSAIESALAAISGSYDLRMMNVGTITRGSTRQ
ncbi:exported hypothetical protein [Vibrio chagasii]|nr:exported hypothetical protein [Vibrio chagasii]